MPESSQLFFSHEHRVALWYLLEEELPPAEPNWMGGEIGGDGQRLLEQSLRKDLNKLHLASGATVAEILRNFVVMLAKPRELVVLLETLPKVFFAGSRGVGVPETGTARTAGDAPAKNPGEARRPQPADDVHRPRQARAARRRRGPGRPREAAARRRPAASPAAAHQQSPGRERGLHGRRWLEGGQRSPGPRRGHVVPGAAGRDHVADRRRPRGDVPLWRRRVRHRAPELRSL